MTNSKSRTLFVIAFTLMIFFQSPSSAESIKPGTFDCELKFEGVSTDSFLVSCADGNEELNRITWTSWNKSGAKGIGYFTWNDCIPICSKGKKHSVRAIVLLSKPQIIKGKLFLTYITWKQIDLQLKPVKNGKRGSWDLLENFKLMGGRI